VRLVSWNIRAGGGRRVEDIYRQIVTWQPDVLILCEFRSTAPSRWLAEALFKYGYVHQREPQRKSGPASNGVFIASHYPLRVCNHRHAPTEPNRWLLVNLQAPARLTIGAMHVPNQFTGRKPAFHEAVLRIAQSWANKPAILMGDTNSGRIGIDEENPVFNKRTDRWFDDLASAGWQDAFRHLHGSSREYTWYSPNHDNGFRLDQAFVNQHTCQGLVSFRHEWGANKTSGRRDALSDHAAIILDLDLDRDGRQTAL
jgi:exodeoxyribonuclease-3